MEFFPLFARLAGQPCLVVGGGEVAHRKVKELLAAGARVLVNAPELSSGIARLLAEGRLSVHCGPFDPGLVEGKVLIIAASCDPVTNAAVAAVARAGGRLCNVVDDGAMSSFIVPATIHREPLVLAITSGGRAPLLARLLRQQLEQWLPSGLGQLAEWAGRWRERVRRALPDPRARRRFWDTLLSGPASRHALAGDGQAADAAADQLLAATARGMGMAWLVGAGPGDPRLITLRGLQALQRAEVILHDRLVAPELLGMARREAELINVGKTPGGRGTGQATINQLLIERVRAGQLVCRLKGGDPLVFGRGGEEALALAAAGLPFEIIPGVTAAAGCAAAAGVPLTHRDLAAAVTLVTARSTPGGCEPDWASLARLDHTLVIYMGSARLEAICTALLRAGRSPTTPAVVVSDGTTPRERQVAATLQDIAARCSAEGIGAPALVFVGATAALAAQLGPPGVGGQAQSPLTGAQVASFPTWPWAATGT